MKILVLNGSPRQGGTVASLLMAMAEPLTEGHEVEWVDVCNLSMRYCTACMACREKGACILPEDDAHAVGEKIREADALIIGTPVHWGNMSAPLKLLFDRNVPVFMGAKREACGHCDRLHDAVALQRHFSRKPGSTAGRQRGAALRRLSRGGDRDQSRNQEIRSYSVGTDCKGKGPCKEAGRVRSKRPRCWLKLQIEQE